MEPGLSPAMPSLGAPRTLSSSPCTLISLHSSVFTLTTSPVGKARFYSLAHCLPPLPRPGTRGSSALSLVSCQLPSILDSPRSLTKGESQVWLSSSLPSSASTNLSLPLFMDRDGGGGLWPAGRKGPRVKWGCAPC